MSALMPDLSKLSGVAQLLKDLQARVNTRDPETPLRRELEQEARFYADVIITKLTQLNICYRYPKSQKDFMSSGTQRVKFRRAVVTPEAVYLEIDTIRLPRGISLSMINEETVLGDLSVSCQRPVRFRSGIESGAWLIIERASGVWGIPAKLSFSDVVENFPKTSNKSLVVPLGVGENRRLVYKSLAEMPHALVGGATGGGKTTLLHSWMCNLVMHNEPWRLKIGFIDLKGGAEASFYNGLPHLLPGGIVVDKGGVAPLLQKVFDMIEGRLTAFRESGVQNVAAWNYRNREEYMPRVVLMVDELANIMLDSTIKKDAQALLADITARGRAPGIHVVLATQRPEVAVVPGLIKANLDARLAFRMTDNASSMVILDDTMSARFDDSTPRGRYIYKRGLDRLQLQAPLITAGQIREIVRAARDGETSESDAARISPEEIFTAAVTQLGGSFSVRSIYKIMDGKASKGYIERLAQEYEGQIVEVEGSPYVLQPSNGGNQPRQLVPIGSDYGKNDQVIGRGITVPVPEEVSGGSTRD